MTQLTQAKELGKEVINTKINNTKTYNLSKIIKQHSKNLKQKKCLKMNKKLSMVVVETILSIQVKELVKEVINHKNNKS